MWNAGWRVTSSIASSVSTPHKTDHGQRTGDVLLRVLAALRNYYFGIAFDAMKPSAEPRGEGRSPHVPATGFLQLLAILKGWKVLVALLAGGYILYCFATSQHIFAHPLPKHTGPYAVGAIDIEAPVSPARTIDPARFKGTTEKAFELQSVLFTLYYPTTYAAATSSRTRRHTWIPKPLSLRAKGYARAAHISNWVTDAIFTGAIRGLVGSITIPAAVDVPLSDQASREAKFATSWNKEETKQQVLASGLSGHPVIIFSHGTVSSRTDYSHYAGELAARGYVVAMLEHRDGSCPGSVIMRQG